MLPSHVGFPRTLVCLVLLLAAGSPAPGQADPPLPAGVTRVRTVEGITEYKLANGLRVLLLPDASQPKVTVNCTIFVGSRHEGYGETGMAHLLEHMLFKGCPKFPDVPKALRDHGANPFNGTTWVDRTNYYETMPATDENLEFGIELEADRLVNSFVKRDDLLSEFTVVRNEFEAGENDPERILLQRVMATAYEWHNYGKSTIGNRTDIERVPIESLQAFYHKYYRPENALLIVAGKFDAAKALGYTAKFFGPLKNPKEPLPKTYTEEPPQDGERVVTLRRVGTVGAVGAAYHIPAAAHPDYTACEVLEEVLTAEPTGRVYKALVETKLASSIYGVAFNWHDPGLLVVGAQTEPGKTEAARDAMLAVLEKLDEKPVTDEEVERAKRRLLQQNERTLANSQSFAVQLSNWAGCGDWRLFFLHRDRLEKLTAADVNRVAREYLIRSNRTVGVYVPTKQPERARVPETPDVAKALAEYKGRTELAAGEAFDPTPENVEKRVNRGAVGEGVKFALLPKKTRGETVQVELHLRFGNHESLKGNVRACNLLGPMLLRGTTSKTRQQIRDEFDRLNATVNIMSTTGQVLVTAQTKRANLAAVLKLLGEVLREPSFPPAEFEILQREELDNLQKGRTEPQMLASVALRRKLTPFPPDDVRYVPTIDESIERIKATTVEQVKTLYTTQLNGGHGELAIVGDFDPAAPLPVIDAFLKGWKSEVPFKRVERVAKAVPGEQIRINTPDKENAVYVAGENLPISDSAPDYPALEVGNYLLGAAPLASRLSNRVRGKEGLSYGVGSQVGASPIDDAGMFMIFAITNPKNIGKVDAAISEEIARFLKDGVSADELEQAKKAYTQSLRVQRGSDATLASQLATALLAGRTFAYYAELEKKVEALQPGDVKRAFDKHIDPKKLVQVQAGDFGKADGEKKK